MDFVSGTALKMCRLIRRLDSLSYETRIQVLLSGLTELFISLPGSHVSTHEEVNETSVSFLRDRDYTHQTQQMWQLIMCSVLLYNCEMIMMINNILKK